MPAKRVTIDGVGYAPWFRARRGCDGWGRPFRWGLIDDAAPHAGVPPAPLAEQPPPCRRSASTSRLRGEYAEYLAGLCRCGPAGGLARAHWELPGGQARGTRMRFGCGYDLATLGSVWGSPLASGDGPERVDSMEAANAALPPAQDLGADEPEPDDPNPPASSPRIRIPRILLLLNLASNAPAMVHLICARFVRPRRETCTTRSGGRGGVVRPLAKYGHAHGRRSMQGTGLQGCA